MTASDLLAMLAQRHSGDVFVPECKDGPSQTRAHLRLDAWALVKTWSPITTIGYEIKVDRNDWRRDDKIHNYMPLCHLLYVVAPPKLVPVEELPAGVGLMEPVGKAGRIQVKRKAARREIQLPAELMVYVLMCRTKITREHGAPVEDRNWRTEQLREWVNGKEERRALSSAVSKKIQAAFDSLRFEVDEQRRRNDELDATRKRMVEMGFDPTQPMHSWDVRRKLEAFNCAVDDRTIDQMQAMSRTLGTITDTLQRIKRGVVDSEEVA
jgi:hypothetical protein